MKSCNHFGRSRLVPKTWTTRGRPNETYERSRSWVTLRALPWFLPVEIVFIGTMSAHRHSPLRARAVSIGRDRDGEHHGFSDFP